MSSLLVSAQPPPRTQFGRSIILPVFDTEAAASAAAAGTPGILCSAGTYCPAGSTAPTPCPLYTASAAGSAAVTDCVDDAGYFEPTAGTVAFLQ